MGSVTHSWVSFQTEAIQLHVAPQTKFYIKY
jgi:hypothetical protein